MSLDEENIKIFSNKCLPNYQNLVNVDFTNCKLLHIFDITSFENALSSNLCSCPQLEKSRETRLVQ